MYTDGWRGNDGLVNVGYDRYLRVNQGENEFSRGEGIHINGFESLGVCQEGIGSLQWSEEMLCSPSERM